MSASFVEELTRFVSNLEWARGSALSASLSWVVSSNGGAQLDDNVILFGISDASRDPVLAVKVPRLREASGGLRNEFERLTEVRDRLGADSASLVPEPIALANLGGRPALLLSYVRGEVARSRGRRSVWNSPHRARSLATDAGRSLRLIHRRTSARLAERERIESDLERKARQFNEAFTLTEAERGAVEDLISFHKSASASATHKVMNQGDFWIGNLIRPQGRGGLVVLDWQFGHWAVDTSLDVYLFLLSGALEAVGHLPSEERARRAVHKLVEWETDVIPAYLEAYGEPRGYVLLPPRLGMMRCCIEKAVRSRFDLGLSHPNDVIWRAFFAEVVETAPEIPS